MSQLTVEACTRGRIRYVLDHLWSRGVEELGRLGLTREGALERFDAYARSNAVGDRAVALVEPNGDPVVVVGIATWELLPSFTWFQATEAFDRHAAAITRYIRREAAVHRGPLAIYSVCVHEATERWFRVLGFRFDPTWQPDGADHIGMRLATGAVLRRFVRV